LISWTAAYSVGAMQLAHIFVCR